MSTDNYDLLAIWDVTDKGRSVPLSYEQFESYILRLDHAVDASRIYARWCSEGLMEATIHAEYILTAKGLAKRKSLPTLRTVPKAKTPEKSGEAAWSRFRRLLSYYIDCVTHQEKKQQNLYANNDGKSFFVPAMPFGWLPLLSDEASKRHEIILSITEENQVTFNNLLARQDDDDPIYIGYPISMYRLKKDKRVAYSPIGLIPVEICKHSRASLSIRLLLDEVEINQIWLENQFSKGEETQQKQLDILMSQLYQLHNSDADPCRGCLDLRAALPFIAKYARHSDGKSLNPDRHEYQLSSKALDDEGSILYNAPILFISQSLIYSKTLRKELRYLRDHVKSDVLDQTALAYVFRDPPLKQERQGEREFAYPFIVSNDQQSQAVEAALNDPISRITGPPGTGKSQVAVNIIANMLYRGKSVIFTSKNHKAIHAIEERSSTMLGDSGMHFMNFCASDDSSTTNLWYQQNLNHIISHARHAFKRSDSICEQRLSLAALDYRAIEEVFEGRQACLDSLAESHSELEHRLEVMRCILELDSVDGRVWNKELMDRCRYLIKNLRDEVTFSWRPRHFIQWLFWKYRYRELSLRAESEIKSLFPEMTEFSFNKLRIRQKLQELKSEISSYLSCRLSCEQAEEMAKKQRSISSAIPRLKSCLEKISVDLQAALIYQRSQNIIEVSQDADLIQRLEGGMQMLSKLFRSHELKSSKNQAIANECFAHFKRFCPAWAPTLLSMTRASPCIPALFDKVIIDEASQCEIAPMIPALFRAKTVTIIGDPEQFPPVIDLKNHSYWEKKHAIDPMTEGQFNYKTSSCFKVVAAPPIQLREHFRCHPDIAAYFNAEFYGNTLIVRTDEERLNTMRPHALGLEHALEWVDVRDSEEAEYQAAADLMQRLVDSRYAGSVGVITPYRQSAANLKERLYPLTKKLIQQDVNINTVNAYQGGERDLIIFVLAYTTKLTKGKRWYVTAAETRYIFNVAISRARASLVVVGDREACRNSDAKVLKSLATYPKGRDPHLARAFESIWEERFYEALLAAGIETTPQRPVSGRRLDLAFEAGNLKLDIEIDGVAYHTNRHGERNTSDILRDIQIEGLGWIVERFWVYELKNDMAACVAKVMGIIHESLGAVADVTENIIDQKPSSKVSAYENDRQDPFPSNMGYRAGYHWLDINDELKAIAEHLDTLIANSYTGSVAILSPCSATALKMKKELSPQLRKLRSQNNQICALGQYKGERSDLIIFALDYRADEESDEWYRSDKARDLINRIVIGKARAGIILVGNRALCKLSEIDSLVNLASKPRQARKSQKQFDSVWEERFYKALTQAGLNPTPQYPVAGRRLDFALEQGAIRLDIEVDGQEYHRTATGARKDSDLFRDAMMRAFGWHILRFRVDELESDMDRCVSSVMSSFGK